MLYKALMSRVERFDIRGEDSKIIIDEKDFLCLLRAAVRNVRVDSSWYTKAYPDVQIAIDRGALTSASDHFVKDGYFENRLPYPVEVDEVYYKQNNPDVAEALAAGKLNNCQEHFFKHGLSEGRDPSNGFSVFD